LQFLKREGLLAPGEIDSDNDVVPLDFTILNNREVGAVHSRYAVRHSHALFITARYASRLASLQRDLKMQQAEFRFTKGAEFKTKYQVDDAMILDPGIMELEDEIMKLTAQVSLMEATLKGYEDLFRAASREMTRRQSEEMER
jgi:hypothetical protein